MLDISQSPRCVHPYNTDVTGIFQRSEYIKIHCIRAVVNGEWLFSGIPQGSDSILNSSTTQD